MDTAPTPNCVSQRSWSAQTRTNTTMLARVAHGL